MTFTSNSQTNHRRSDRTFGAFSCCAAIVSLMDAVIATASIFVALMISIVLGVSVLGLIILAALLLLPIIIILLSVGNVSDKRCDVLYPATV